jgi:hypothetical protein
MTTTRKLLTSSAILLGAALAASAQDWPQWARNPRHTGAVPTEGQRADRILAQVVYDPFTDQENNDPFCGGGLCVHYQTPLVDGNDVYLELKSGTYTSLLTWETQAWNEQRLHWEDGALVRKWLFQSDWKPIPYGSLNPPFRGPGLEPVFHVALSGGFVYVPGFGGTVWKLAKDDGSVVAHINPFATVDPDTFLSGPITVDSHGSIYYATIKLAHPANDSPWDVDVVNSWLVKVTADGSATKVTFASLTPGAPTGNNCLGTFSPSDLPWPPSPDAVPPNVPCGIQRAAMNSAPAVAPDGTIYVGSVAHLWSFEAFLVAANPDLSPRWHTSLRDRFHDGCNVLLPPNGTPGGCRAGAHTGVDPAQNRPGAGRIADDATSSPVVTPDGSVIFGTFSRYNYAQGHLMKFSSRGEFLAAYEFGWDDTPSIYSHEGTYSILTKDNHYNVPSYCNNLAFCPRDRTATNPSNPKEFFITQLDANLVREWRYKSTNTQSCTRNPDGTITCVSDHPQGFEWCINASAVDENGVLYANSEDGNVYEIRQGGTVRSHLFLNLAVSAPYTPVAIGTDGKVYSENFGTMFVVGENDENGGHPPKQRMVAVP